MTPEAGILEPEKSSRRDAASHGNKEEFLFKNGFVRPWQTGKT
jgi:hypothetical protein